MIDNSSESVIKLKEKLEGLKKFSQYKTIADLKGKVETLFI